MAYKIEVMTPYVNDPVSAELGQVGVIGKCWVDFPNSSYENITDVLPPLDPNLNTVRMIVSDADYALIEAHADHLVFTAEQVGEDV